MIADSSVGLLRLLDNELDPVRTRIKMASIKFVKMKSVSCDQGLTTYRFFKCHVHSVSSYELHACILKVSSTNRQAALEMRVLTRILKIFWLQLFSVIWLNIEKRTVNDEILRRIQMY